MGIYRISPWHQQIPKEDGTVDLLCVQRGVYDTKNNIILKIIVKSKAIISYVVCRIIGTQIKICREFYESKFLCGYWSAFPRMLRLKISVDCRNCSGCLTTCGIGLCKWLNVLRCAWLKPRLPELLKKVIKEGILNFSLNEFHVLIRRLLFNTFVNWNNLYEQ